MNGVLVRSCLSLWVEAFAFLVQLCCDSASAAVIGSEPRDVIRNVSPQTFSHNRVVKIGGWFQTTHFDQKKRYNEGKVCDKYKI